MAKISISVSLEEDMVEEIDKEVDAKAFDDRSSAIRYYLKQGRMGG